MEQTAKENGIPFRAIHIQNREEAQNAPTPITNYALFHDGEYITNEQKAGYYECQICHDRHIPTYWQTNLAPHIGRTRYMKCPACGKRSYQKKVLTKEK